MMKMFRVTNLLMMEVFLRKNIYYI